MPSSAEGYSGPAILGRKAFKGRMGRARSVPAVRDRRVPALRGNAEQPNARQVGERVLRRLDAAHEVPFPEGSLVRERPGGEGGMGLHMPNRPDAAPGIPKGRVAPVHGPETRIGTGDPRAVAQPQAVQRLVELAFRTTQRHSAAQTPQCRFHTSGSATCSAVRRSNPDSRRLLRDTRPPAVWATCEPSQRAETPQSRRIIVTVNMSSSQAPCASRTLCDTSGKRPNVHHADRRRIWTTTVGIALAASCYDDPHGVAAPPFPEEQLDTDVAVVARDGDDEGC